MSEPTRGPEDAPSTTDEGYQDNRYHDEELEIEADEHVERSLPRKQRRQLNRRPPPRRCFIEG